MCRPLNLWFFCNCTATTELYTLSLHDALPISLPTTVEGVAGGRFTREAIAVVKNRQFIEFCDRVEDPRTASLYRDVIEPDERYHHELGRTLLLRLATTASAQDAARRAARRTLELAEELQSAAFRTAGIHHAPGC